MSHHPSTDRPPITIPGLQQRVCDGQRLVMTTAYDAVTAGLADPIVDMILVGDSVGNVCLGFDNDASREHGSAGHSRRRRLSTVMTVSPSIEPFIWALNTRLIAGATATETLLAWCEEHGLSEGPITVEIRQRFAPALVPDAVLPALELDPGETIHYRQVRLMRGSLPLAAAENWFVPQRLTAAMNEALLRTNVPFGQCDCAAATLPSHARGEPPTAC